ncbi:GDP-L-fucose synthase [Geoalkalibacter ferrihydriticus]|uniref:GDP-L-fucose synthase n=2 Tax=Geoalkalibacter ferrihydriticus TaxID=392333 RepID=A0A0C2HSN0_9BACT|nr:GDP-L-fucose synthase [Geoalkalibacter ferrihydriticus]KIH75772.1 GDP-L-fucose synthase [Geoalkalibacter ferrihydriticus DSM 17813]SDM64392.1 GDP-L-fucose synthase [Geoalkalibacter ferrihydriticus]
MNKHAKIFVAGHKGLVGSAIVRRLQSTGYDNLLLRSRTELDLCEQAAVRDFFAQEKPAYVFLAAAKVGGIVANNTWPAEFIYENLAIQTNVIHAAWQSGVKRLLFLGSSCIYPKFAPQPMREEHLLTGELEPTNEPYAVAKIAGIKMCQSYNRQYGTHFLSVMPTNLYGPNDNFDLTSSHVIPALLRKIHEAKINAAPSVEIWGTGQPRREFLHVDDMADACLFVMQASQERLDAEAAPFFNVGTGSDVTIAELARTICEVVDFNGALIFNTDKPDGAPRKLLDVERLRTLGWRAKVDLRQGLDDTYRWFLQHRQ